MAGESDIVLRTARLALRRWRPGDREAFTALNADPRVMAHFMSPLSRPQSDAFADMVEQELAERPFGLWAVEIPGVTPFAGFVGLHVPSFTAHFTPCVEIGWRLAAAYWGRGYATEAARAALAYAWDPLGLAEIVSFTTVKHVRSRAVMERIGMRRDSADDFDHPRLPEGHPLRPHVLYRARPIAAVTLEGTIASAFAKLPTVPLEFLVYPGTWETEDLLCDLAPIGGLPDARFIEQHASSLPAFTALGLRHVLPQYLIYSLKHPDSDAAERVIFHLSPNVTSSDYWRERLDVFSPIQKSAICAYLRHMHVLLAGQHYASDLELGLTVWGAGSGGVG